MSAERESKLIGDASKRRRDGEVGCQMVRAEPRALRAGSGAWAIFAFRDDLDAWKASCSSVIMNRRGQQKG